MDTNPEAELDDLVQLDLGFLARRIGVHEYRRRYLGLCRRMPVSEAEAQIIEAAAHLSATTDEAELREQVAGSLAQLKVWGVDVSDHT